MITKRQVFYSFHYKPDNWRVSQVRNIGTIEGNKPAPDNDWEQITRAGDDAIKKWIAEQMKQKSCTIVLIGSDTANRKWINHEIIESWKNKMGVAGIYIHGLKNQRGETSEKGGNPFDYWDLGNIKLSSVIRCYNPEGGNSKEKYDWISRHIAYITNEAVGIRKGY